MISCNFAPSGIITIFSRGPRPCDKACPSALQDRPYGIQGPTYLRN